MPLVAAWLVVSPFHNLRNKCVGKYYRIYSKSLKLQRGLLIERMRYLFDGLKRLTLILAFNTNSQWFVASYTLS